MNRNTSPQGGLAKPGNIAIVVLAFVALVGLFILTSPAQSRPPLGVTNFDAIHLRSAEATAVPLLRVRNTGNSRSFEIQDTGGTPEVVINANGGMTINNLTLSTVTAPVLGYPTPGTSMNCKQSTITDTVSYTSTVTAISTPRFGTCTLESITGDAAGCALDVGNNGSITVTVRNAAATPAANAAGAVVNWCAGGTP